MKAINLRIDKDTAALLCGLQKKKKHLSQNAIICEAIRRMAFEEKMGVEGR